jgi:hypothetical protein
MFCKKNKDKEEEVLWLKKIPNIQVEEENQSFESFINEFFHLINHFLFL